MTEEVIVLEPGDERAQKIGKAIASPTANEILHLLAEGPKTASDLTEVMSIPMGTLKYHIENLLEAGLIEITETRYSVKGREVKVYGLRDQLLIVAPKVTSIRSILLKYASLFVIVIVASMAMFAILPLLQHVPPVAGPAPVQNDAGGAGTFSEKALSADNGLPLQSPAGLFLGFFMGGCLVLLVLLLYEVYRWKKDSNPRP